MCVRRVLYVYFEGAPRRIFETWVDKTETAW